MLRLQTEKPQQIGGEMSDVFSFDDPFYPVPPEAADADPEALVQELIQRVVTSERALDQERVQAIADKRDLLLDLVSLADDVGRARGALWREQ